MAEGLHGRQAADGVLCGGGSAFQHRHSGVQQRTFRAGVVGDQECIRPLAPKDALPRGLRLRMRESILPCPVNPRQHAADLRAVSRGDFLRRQHAAVVVVKHIQVLPVHAVQLAPTDGQRGQNGQILPLQQGLEALGGTVVVQHAGALHDFRVEQLHGVASAGRVQAEHAVGVAAVQALGRSGQRAEVQFGTNAVKHTSSMAKRPHQLARPVGQG